MGAVEGVVDSEGAWANTGATRVLFPPVSPSPSTIDQNKRPDPQSDRELAEDGAEDVERTKNWGRKSIGIG